MPLHSCILQFIDEIVKTKISGEMQRSTIFNTADADAIGQKFKTVLISDLYLQMG